MSSVSGAPAGLEARFVLRRPAFTLDVDLRLEPGEVLAVLGPNGAGKSTVLGVLAGLLRPDEGYVRIGDATVTDVAAGTHVPPHRRGVGLLAQQALLFPHMSALANVAFGPRAHGVPRRAAEARARELLSDVDVAALADRRPTQLSGGQAQRIALARALAPDPGLLLLDEPLAALDVDASPALRGLLRRMVAAAKQTALLVTHDALDALVLADTALVLIEGTVAEHGPTRDVLTRPRSPFAARIAGLNLVNGVAEEKGLRVADGTLLAGRHPEPLGHAAPAVAVFPPAAVTVFRERPTGASVRNAVEVTVAALEPRGDVVRLRAAPVPSGPDWVDGLAADVTPAAVADLATEPGDRLWFAVKAMEVAVHPVGR